jgi:hypothetical protein
MTVKDIIHWPIALHLDLAALVIALLGATFSVVTWINQRRQRQTSIRIERDNDLIPWIDSLIDILVEAEFLLRSWSPSLDEKEFSAKRNASLAKLAAAIDKGRLFFPDFSRDVIAPAKRQSAPESHQAILDLLVEIYDLLNEPFQNAETLAQTRQALLVKKRDLIVWAQDEVHAARRGRFSMREHEHKGPRS